MSYLVLAYPSINKKDYNWIQNFREKYDIRFYGIVEPHFTIVFPINNVGESIFIKHVKKHSKDVKTINFSIKCSIIVKDSFSDYTDIFLTPDEGNSAIIKLHDRLYTGAISSELRLDIPFIVHIAIGASKNGLECKKLSDKINEKNLCIKGVVDSLDVIWYDYPEVRTIEKIQLH
jgi:hypothetical protein